MIRRLAPVAAATALALALIPALPAAAAVVTTVGHATVPSQPFLGNPDPSDWLGGYTVGGEQVFAVRFGHPAPDSDEAAGAAVTLDTKWATALTPDVSLQVAYLLWRYGDTESADTAAAIAHVLHTWTSGPQNPGQLDPANDFRHIAYDAPFHLSRLPAGAQAQVASLVAEAPLYADLWVSSVLPSADLQVGVASVWTLGLRTGSTATPLPNAAVRVEVTGGILPGGVTSLELTTGPVGEPIEVEVTPTAESVTVTMFYDQLSSAARMVPAVEADTAAWVRRADNVVGVSASREVAAAPAEVVPAAPTLPATGVESPVAALLAGAAALFAGAAALLAGLVFVARRGAVRPQR